MNHFKYILLTALCIILCGCYEDFESTTVVTQSIEPGISVRHDIAGTVIDTSGNVIENATIKINERVAISNQEGRFELQSIEINEFGSFLSVTHSDYIKTGIRIYPHSSLIHELGLTLIYTPRSSVLSNTTGGRINSADGVELTFQSESVTKDGTLYNGNYKVVVFYIDPQNKSNYNKQLRAYDIDNNTNSFYPKIEAYSMASITIIDENGEELQLNPNKPVEVKFPAFNDNSSLPNSASLLSFNEKRGLWEEEGNAMYINNKYEASLSHFSWWSISNTKSTSEFCFTFESSLDDPPSNNIYVLNTLSGNHIQAGRVDYKNETCIPVPDDEDLHLTVYNFCTNKRAEVTIISSDISNKQVINVNDNTIGYSVKLNIINCQAGPLPGNYAISYNDGTLIEINGDSFEIQLDQCFDHESLNIVVEDLATGALYSKILTLDNTQNSYDATIEICGTTPTEAVLIIDGHVYENCVAQVNPEEVLIYSDEPSLLIGFDYVESGETECRVIYSQIAEEGIANIIEVGNVGDYVTGTFEAKNNSDGKLIKGSFKALRNK